MILYCVVILSVPMVRRKFFWFFGESEFLMILQLLMLELVIMETDFGFGSDYLISLLDYLALLEGGDDYFLFL